MLQIKVFGPIPPCANCMRAEKQARKAAEQFGGRVQVVHLNAMGPDATHYGVMVTPTVVVGEQVVSSGKAMPADKLIPIIESALGG